MTTVKDLKAALEGFDENLDVKIVMRPIHPEESVDGHEAGDIYAEQKTFVQVTYCYPLIRSREPKSTRQLQQQQHGRRQT